MCPVGSFFYAYTLRSPSPRSQQGGILQRWRLRLIQVPCPRTPGVIPGEPRFGTLLLSIAASVGRLLLAPPGKGPVTGTQRCTVPDPGPAQGLPTAFPSRAILLLVTIYFSIYYPQPAAWNIYTDTKKSRPSHCLHFITLNLFSPLKLLEERIIMDKY